eukprot:276073-Rhodomonas_salina.2
MRLVERGYEIRPGEHVQSKTLVGRGYEIRPGEHGGHGARTLCLPPAPPYLSTAQRIAST